MINENNIVLNPDPISQFKEWFESAKRHEEIAIPDACYLATISPDGYPEGRVILLKGINDDSVVFYSNSESDKGKSLDQNPRASLAFHWEPLGYQIRFQGDIEFVADADADAYFESRPRLSQIGAWASQQSRERKELLAKRVKAVEEEFAPDKTISRPPHWKGYRLIPRKVEFWIDRPYRLHDRFIYTKKDSGWLITSVDP